MAKRILVILFFALAAALWRGAGWFPGVRAQKPRPAATPSKYGDFKHSSHEGRVKSLIANGLALEIDCVYCHGTVARDRLGKDQHDLQIIGFPSHRGGLAAEKVHSACSECHAFTGPKIELRMCGICHTATEINPQKMKTNIRRFVDPNGNGRSEFYDAYSHAEHVDFFDQYATATPLKDRLKFYDAKQDAKANKGLDKTHFECAACHAMNAAPVSVASVEFAPGVKESAPGHAECFVCHFDSKIVTPPKKEKPDPKNTFATNCTGCHRAAGAPMRNNRPAKGSEFAPAWFARAIVNTELNPKPAAPRPGVKTPPPKTPLPFSHKTHEENVGKTTQDCLSCHATGKTAQTRADFFLEDRKNQEKQPQIASCVECHKKEMQTRIEGAVTIESAKCNYCHALQTVREFAARGSALPPANHFGKKGGMIATTTTGPVPPTPTPAPAPTPMAKPAPTPTPAAKPTPTPTPAAKPTPTPTPAAKPTPTPTPATKPTPTPTPEPPKIVAVAVPAPTPAPPTPTPAPAPAPAETTPRAAPAGRTMPTTLLLGDPAKLPKDWEFQRVPTPFDHRTHIQPSYAQNCQVCHHTNKDAQNEAVEKCSACHFPEGLESKGKSKVNFKVAYHGDPDNAANQAGCIECHKRFYEKNPDRERVGPTSKCAACHVEKTSRLAPGRAPRNAWLAEQWVALFRNEHATR